MKLINTTDFDDRFLRKLVAWCCRELDIPVRSIRTAKFKQWRTQKFSGRAQHWTKHGKAVGDIMVGVGPDKMFPWTDHGRSPGIKGIVRTLNDRLECLVNVTAHEVRHVAAEHYRERSRGGVGRHRYYASSEQATERSAQKLLAKFRENREQLLAEWGKLSKQKPAAAKPTAADAAEAKQRHYEKLLKQWEAKEKRAKTAIKKYRAKVRYYERRVAATKGKEERCE